MPSSKSTLFLLLAVALYAVGHLNWYLDTPMGQSPVLDGQENLLIAQQIKEGSLPAEPFYRAMLYPALLALLPIHWAVLGLAAHLANTLLVVRIAARFWRHEIGALVAGALVGFNPVLLHFAFDPLDATLSCSLFLVALHCLQKAQLRQSLYSVNTAYAAAGGAALALATLARPHFLAALVPAALILIFAAYRRRVTVTNALAFSLAALLPLLAYGFLQKSVGGSFGILPWQGAYNLWVSNKPGANGLYYQQTIEFHYTGEHENPNRLESEQLYRQETGRDGSIPEITAFWRAKTIRHILAHPIDWSLLMGFKTYAAFNNFEQYNNKTYSFHKRLSPWLRYNPLGWGLLLAGATFACATLWRQIRPDLVPLLVLCACYLAGMLVYMASARFRLPLVPVLAILCGGIPYAIEAIKVSSTAARRRAAIATLAAIAIAFTAFGPINAKDTYLQDMLLMADASATTGRDREAITWATAALQLAPTRQSAKRVVILSRYNLAASGQTTPDRPFWEEQARDLEGLALDDGRLAFVAGLAHWNIGNANQALALWQAAHERHGLAASQCLAAIAAVAPAAVHLPHDAELLALLQTGEHPILACVAARRLSADQRQSFLDAIGLTPERYQLLDQSLARVLPLP